MKLQTLKLRNFQAVRDLTIDFNGQDTSIWGQNASGKTTIANSFFWLLFNKDSLNQTDFEIKTLDESGKPYPGLDHEVEGVIEIDGKMLTVRKIYSEVWTKKRASATNEFTGNKTDYFVDGVPISKREYEDRIANIISEDAFKLLTNPRFFNVFLPWQKRREILLSVCGDVSDTDVIASDSKLASLPAILNGRKLEDHRRAIMAEKTKLNSELSTIPVRIDEATRALPQVDHVDALAIADEIVALTAQKNALLTKRNLTANGGGITDKQKAIKDFELEITTLERAQQNENDAAMWHTKTQLNSVMDEADRMRRDIKNKEDVIGYGNSAAAQLDVEMDALRNRKNLIFTSSFQYEANNTCPTCKQTLPENQVKAALDKAFADFNSELAEKLETIQHNGLEAKSRKETLLANNTQLTGEIVPLKAKLADLEKQASELNAKLSCHDDSKPEGYFEKCVEKAKIEKEIVELGNGNASELTKIDTEIATLQIEIDKKSADILKIKQRESGLKRVDELKAQEKKLNKEWEKLESELFLTEEFVKTKVRMLTDRINNKFLYARFKLFDVQVNGAIAECCETTYNGVPYNSLNNSMQINLGLDLINTLAEHYKFRAPIFIDNAEAVVNLLPTKGQQIKLYVSSSDPVLRVQSVKELAEVK